MKNLDDCYPDKWIDYGGTVPWPPRSPDLISFDILWQNWRTTGHLPCYERSTCIHTS